VFQFLLEMSADEFASHGLVIRCDEKKTTAANPSLKSEVAERADGIFMMSELGQMRLGTRGIYNLYGNSLTFRAYVSKFGVPLTPADSYRVTLHANALKLQSPTPIAEGFENIKPEITSKGIDERGFFTATITAPRTLMNAKGELPRWTTFYYLDSYIYSLQLSIAKSISSSSAPLKLAQMMPMGHDDHHGTLTDALTLSAEDQKSDEDGTESASYTPFAGGLLVFHEEDEKELPSIITWQPGKRTAESADEWQEVIDNLPKRPHIRPIFRQYANLYPVMRDIVDLDSYDDVTSKLPALKRAFNAPLASPHYMPVVRDLSGQKLMLINSWLNNPIFCDTFVDEQSKDGGFLGIIRSRDSLQRCLQMAIELELSTLPPYLSALYSMDPNAKLPNHANEQIIALIRSIVHQEMTHLALACNLLRAIGGTPRIAHKEVVGESGRCCFPRKGLIPETPIDDDGNTVGVFPDLELTLAPMRVKNKAGDAVAQPLRTFLRIEEPANFDIDQIIRDDDHKFDILSMIGPGSKLVFESNPLRMMKPMLLASVQQNEQQQQNTFEFTQTTIKFQTLSAAAQKKESKDNGDESGDEKVSVKEDVPVDPDGTLTAADYSIGGFYELIRKGFMYLSTHPNAPGGGKDLFVVDNATKAAETQIGADMMESCNVVYNVQTALTAIESIVAEGEGTSMTDLHTSGGLNSNLSHFHKFLEIAKGNPLLLIRRNDDAAPGVFPYSYVFAKDVTIPFDADGVVDDADAWDWLDSSKPESFGKYADEPRVQRFNRDYGRMLMSLQEVLGSGRKHKLNSAISLMRQLQVDFNDCLRPQQSAQKPIAPNWVPPSDMLL